METSDNLTYQARSRAAANTDTGEALPSRWGLYLQFEGEHGPVLRNDLHVSSIKRGALVVTSKPRLLAASMLSLMVSAEVLAAPIGAPIQCRNQGGENKKYEIPSGEIRLEARLLTATNPQTRRVCRFRLTQPAAQRALVELKLASGEYIGVDYDACSTVESERIDIHMIKNVPDVPTRTVLHICVFGGP